MTNEQLVVVLGREFTVIQLQIQALVDLTVGQAAFDTRLQQLVQAEGSGARAHLRHELRGLMTWAQTLTPARLAQMQAQDDQQWVRWQLDDLFPPEE